THGGQWYLKAKYSFEELSYKIFAGPELTVR
ncbi:MAG: hypothetical protein ACI9Z9_001497, partial [Litorivivens sp.]